MGSKPGGVTTATLAPTDITAPIRWLLRKQENAQVLMEEVVRIDSMTPKLLIHPDPASGLEAKFSMPFCAAAALVLGHPGVDTFEKRAIA